MADYGEVFEVYHRPACGGSLQKFTTRSTKTQEHFTVQRAEKAQRPLRMAEVIRLARLS